ncbi:NUDIX domain-containing protein [Patescibacteria group bacterium]|nr:NUDIX domain-containing protein [Patescibacteria group bacterium]
MTMTVRAHPKRFAMITASYLFLIRDQKILLSRRYRTGYEDGKYSVPAGHVEDGETLTEAASREVGEEIGLSIRPRDFILVHVMHRKSTDIRTDFFFTAKQWSGTPVNREPGKCDDLRWFPLEHLPQTTIPYIRQAIEAYRKGKIYSEFGWAP